MRKWLIIFGVLFYTAAISISIVMGHEQKLKGEDGPSLTDPEPANTGFFVSAPDDSILFFMANEGSLQLMRDMADGRMPISCNVLYDAMGSRPEVTVTDPETIVELYTRLAQMTVGDVTPYSVTDAYHHIYFTLDDGTMVGWNFETEACLCWGATNYETHDNGNLWGYVQEQKGTVLFCHALLAARQGVSVRQVMYKRR